MNNASSLRNHILYDSLDINEMKTVLKRTVLKGFAVFGMPKRVQALLILEKMPVMLNICLLNPQKKA